MGKIIPVSELQKRTGSLEELTTNSYIIVTNRGKAKCIVLPYFQDNDEAVSEYLDAFEMQQNQEILKARYKESSESGLSDLIV